MTSKEPQDQPKEVKAGRLQLKRPRRGAKLARQKELNPFGVDLKGTLESTVDVNHSGKTKTMRSQPALLLRLREMALQGDLRSLERFLDIAQRYNSGSSGKAATPAQDHAVIAAFAKNVRALGPSMSSQQPLPGSHAALAALLRTRLGFFIRKVFATVSPGDSYLHNWHIEAIEHQLMMVHQRANGRLLITQPPRSLKSICVSVAYVAWLLGHDPTRRVIVASYSGDFTAELHRQFRMVIDSSWYKALFPNMRIAKDTGFELVTSQGGGRYATSVGGTLTGRGADLIIVDDPLNANEIYSEPARKRVIDWYGGALVSRLNEKRTGKIIVVMQRLHEDDLAGHLLRQGGWTHLNIPAIASEEETFLLGDGRTHLRQSGDVLHPERESRQALEAIKAEVGSLLFSAQYQQQPVPMEGNLILWKWFSQYDELPSEPGFKRIVQSWDVAMMTSDRNDYSVCSTWLLYKGDAYLVHAYRGRLEYPDLRRKVIDLTRASGDLNPD